jgi:hypothetical protein
MSLPFGLLRPCSPFAGLAGVCLVSTAYPSGEQQDDDDDDQKSPESDVHVDLLALEAS